MGIRLALAGLLLVPIQPVRAQDPGASVEQILEDGGYQTELPVGGTGGTGEGGGDGSPGPETVPAERRNREVPPTWFFGAGSGWGVVVWVVLGVAVVGLLLWYLLRTSGRHRDVEITAGPQASGEPEAAPVSFPPADEAARLAGEGRYGEAIRLLLNRALEAVARSTGQPLAPSWTSREVLRTAPLPDRARAPLRALIAAEERSLFARRPPGPADYESCAAQYRTLRAGSADG